MSPTHPAWHNAMQAAFERYTRDPDEFRVARALTLPADKQSLPKLVLLDTLHWIDLAKASGGQQASRFADVALAALQGAVKRGSVVVACTDTNIEEIGRRGDESSRVECAEFLVSLSCNYSLASHLHVQSSEIYNAVEGRPATCGIRPALMSWGLKHSFSASAITTGNDVVDALINAVLDYPELSVCSVAHLLDRATIVATRQHGESTISKARAVRALDQNLGPDDRVDAELQESYGRRILPPLLQQLGLAPRSFEQRLSTWQARRDFWLPIPSVDVFTTIMHQRDRNLSAPTKLNDVNDIGLLKVGIPYANFVATENLWANVTRQTGIAARYGCFVTSDLGDLVTELGAQGCL